MKSLLLAVTMLFSITAILPQDAIILCAKNGLHLFKSCCDGPQEIVKVENDSCCQSEETVVQESSASLKDLCCHKQESLQAPLILNPKAIDFACSELADAHLPFWHYFDQAQIIQSIKTLSYSPKTSPPALERLSLTPLFKVHSSYLC